VRFIIFLWGVWIGILLFAGLASWKEYKAVPPPAVIITNMVTTIVVTNTPPVQDRKNCYPDDWIQGYITTNTMPIERHWSTNYIATNYLLFATNIVPCQLITGETNGLNDIGTNKPPFTIWHRDGSGSAAGSAYTP
jgi:hypothetical protein